MKEQLILKKSVIAVALTLASSQLVWAQTTPAEPIAQKITITGSNIKRVNIEGSSPILTLSSKEIASTGANTISELLHSVPAFGSGASVDFVDGGFSKGTSTASLRGLGSSSTLILLNGRRITASAYADPNQGKSTVYDLNTIPLSAIERVEIFKDGASAIYGSDAVAGVINFITKTNYQGAEISANIAANDKNDFGRKGASGAFGFGDLASQGYNAFISFDVSERNSTKIKDVEDIQAGKLAAINARLNPFSSSLSDQPFFYRERTPGALNFSNSLARKADVINSTNCPDSKKITGTAALHNLSATDVLNDRTFCNYDVDNFSEAQSAGKDANLLGRATFNLSPNTTAFTEFGYSRSQRRYTGAPIALRSTTSTTTFTLTGAPTQFQIVLPVGHPDNPFPTSRAAVGFRLVNEQGGTANLNEGYRFVGGLKGTAGAWDWESAALWNRSKREETFFGRQYKPTMQRIYTENRTIAATIADPTAAYDVINKGFAQVAQLDAKASTEFGHLGGGAIGFAFGGEIRQDSIGLTPDAELQKGNIVGLVNSSADGKRNVSSAFVELRTPWTKTFEMDFAGRYDKYPNLSASLVPKVGGKWTPSEHFAVRGTFAKGFVAPALVQVSPGGVQSFTTVTDTVRCPDGVNPLPGADKIDCSKSIGALSSATPGLKPEKSKSYNLGFILAPTKDLDVLVDFYKIRKESETALLGAQTVIDRPATYPGRVIRDTNIANQLIDASGNPILGTGPIQQVNRAYVNQGATEVSGIDLEVAMRNSLGAYGKLRTKLAVGYTISYKRAENQGDAEHNVVGTNGGIADWATSVGDLPRKRINLSTSWTTGEHELTGSVNYVGSISLLRRYDNKDVYPVPYCHYGTGQPSTAYQLGGLPKYSDFPNNCDVGGWTTIGANYNYTGFKNMTLSFNIQNLFDTAAPYDPRSATTGFNTQLHNGYGRYFRLGLNYKFK